MSSAPVSSDSPSPSERTSFPIAQGRTKGYDRAAVDDFLARARGVFEGETGDALTSESVRRAAFPLTRHGYVIAAVDAALARIEDAFAARERETALADGGVGGWVGATRGTACSIA